VQIEKTNYLIIKKKKGHIFKYELVSQFFEKGHKF